MLKKCRNSGINSQYLCFRENENCCFNKYRKPAFLAQPSCAIVFLIIFWFSCRRVPYLYWYCWAIFDFPHWKLKSLAWVEKTNYSTNFRGPNFTYHSVQVASDRTCVNALHSSPSKTALLDDEWNAQWKIAIPFRNF